MKTHSSTKLAALSLLVAFAAATSARAQTTGAVSPADAGAGLVGQAYTGLTFGYVHHMDSPPRALHRYGIFASRPIDDLGPNVDAAFRYEYTTSSRLGVPQDRHDAAVSLTRYWAPDEMRRFFVNGEFGGAWQHATGNDTKSVMFGAGAGVEILIAPRAAVTPFFNYRETSHLHDHAWHFGARVAYRVNRDWVTALTAQIDDASNVEYTAGILRHF